MKIIKVENICYQTYPCKHYITLEYNEGKIETVFMSWLDIYELSKKTNFDLSHINCSQFYTENEIHKLKNPPISEFLTENEIEQLINPSF